MFCLHCSLGFKDFLVHFKNSMSPNTVSRLRGASGLANMRINIVPISKSNLKIKMLCDLIRSNG